eukprot:Hpha_TRINITY_DN902_c0_g1::TRINITY_DN902_c0_g1_i1::g.156190::m.156190/K14958/KSR1; kinase suppressor of Ras 1
MPPKSPRRHVSPSPHAVRGAGGVGTGTVLKRVGSRQVVPGSGRRPSGEMKIPKAEKPMQKRFSAGPSQMAGTRPRARSGARGDAARRGRTGSQMGSARSDNSKKDGVWQPPPTSCGAPPQLGSSRNSDKAPGWRARPIKTAPISSVLSADAPATTIKAQPVKRPAAANGTQSPGAEPNRPSRRKRKIQLSGLIPDNATEKETQEGETDNGAAGLMKELLDELQIDSPAPPEECKSPLNSTVGRQGSFLRGGEEGWAETMDNFGIVPMDLTVDTQCELGRNKLGVVYRGDYQATEVAVKLLVSDGRSHGGQREWRNEVAVLSKLRHPNVLQMLGAVFDPQAGLAIVTELCPDGTVRSAVWEEAYGNATSWTKRLMSPPSEWMRKLEWLLQITKGMAFLHYKRVFHRDLKASNVLLSGGTCKITGFGMSGTRRDAEMALRLKHSSSVPKSSSVVSRPSLQHSFAVAEEHALRTRRRRTAPQDRGEQRQPDSVRVLEEGKEESGTFAYCAPEVWPELPTSKPFSNAADVYSFGVLLIEVVAARVPFDGVRSEGEAKVARQIASNLARPRMPANVGSSRVPGFLRDVASRCLSYVPGERPSFRELIDELKHEVHSSDYRLQPCSVPFANDEPGEEEKVEEFDEGGEF